MILATPGPVEVPFFVQKATLGETIHHRTPEFKKILEETLSLFKKLVNLDDAVFLASSGSGAMEAAMINVVKKKALCVNAGKFGERWGKIASAWGLEFTQLCYEWNTPANVDDIMATIKSQSDIDSFFIQISESAGGLRHDVEEIARQIKQYNPEIIVVADGITAVGVEYIDTTNIDILITGSQKALMLPPGLAMLGFSQQAIKRIGDGRGFYFNLATEIKKQREFTTAFTPATTLIIALKEVLHKLIDEIGLDTLYHKTAIRHEALLKSLEAIGLQIYPTAPAKSMATIYHEDAQKIRNIMKEKYQVNIAGGQDHLKGKIFRINNMGLIEDHKMLWIVNSIEKTLDDLGVREYDATASKIFSQINKID
ncbi:MAG: alanine--glyoxylate aminotransferase family protein [Epsilonproteobacteria bacterium]|nr:alanine--glyoxylate aminotransferase family protein [Campylobacterota bacterium]